MADQVLIWSQNGLILLAKLADDGELTISGHDLSGVVYEEYEYWITVPAPATPAIVRALGGGSSDDVLSLLEANGELIDVNGGVEDEPVAALDRGCRSGCAPRPISGRSWHGRRRYGRRAGAEAAADDVLRSAAAADPEVAEAPRLQNDVQRHVAMITSWGRSPPAGRCGRFGRDAGGGSAAHADQPRGAPHAAGSLWLDARAVRDLAPPDP